MWNVGWLWSQCMWIEPHLELIWLHWAILPCCGEIRVPLELCQCSWGLSGVPSSKSRLLTRFLGNTEFLCTQCWGIRPNLTATGKSHGFSRVAVGTWGIFSSCGRDGSSKLVIVQWRQDSFLVMRDTSGISSRLGRAIRTLLDVRRETQHPFLVATVIMGFLSIRDTITLDFL